VREEREVEIDQGVGDREPLPRRGDGAEPIDDPLVAAEEIGVGPQVLVVRHRGSACLELHHVDDVERQSGQRGQPPRQRGLATACVAEDRHPSHAPPALLASRASLKMAVASARRRALTR